jgi:ubiquinone/menaquinone biosynthesis C-methylase UbiE
MGSAQYDEKMKNNNIFDELAEKYDAWYDSDEGMIIYESEFLCLTSLIEDISFPMLEIGVGTGRFAMRFPDIIGVDPSVNALKIAKSRGLKTLQAIGEDLPFDDKTFKYVLIIVTLCFAEDPLAMLKEAKRVLRTDGYIIIGIVPKDSPWGLFYEEKKKNGHPFYSHSNFYTLRDVEAFLKTLDMQITAISSTLLQHPDEPRRIELPVKGYVKGAGFICIEAKKSIS